MRDEIAAQLLELNQAFYSRFAESFAQSRNNPQPGFVELVGDLPHSCERVLDVGCGNGRFGRFLQTYLVDFDYSGIDFTVDFLALAAELVGGTFYERDISRQGFLDGTGGFDLIVCLATLQHVPSRAKRAELMREMGEHLAPNGRLFLSTWQFMSSTRQRRKIRSWELVGLSDADVENDDYLLSWQREGEGLRYVCLVDENETAALIEEAGLVIEHQFCSDGKEGNLNLYTICKHAN